MTTEFNASLKALNDAFPQYVEEHKKFHDYVEKKLYHELTDALSEYLAKEEFASKKPCKPILDYFEASIVGLHDYLNPLRFQHIVYYVINHCKDELAVQVLLDGLKEKVEPIEKYGTNYYYKSLKAECLIKLGQIKEAQDLLDDKEDSLKNAMNIDSTVYSRFYNAQLQVCEKTKEFPLYFKAAMSYLNYTTTDKIENPTNLAFNVILSCLLSPNEFDFGDLLQRDFLKCLDGHANEWAKNLLIAFHDGKFQSFDEVLTKHATQMNQVPELKDSKSILEQKFSLMALVELAFQQPKKSRKLDFSNVSRVCRVPQDRVEHLLMRAMSLKLIEGKIDHVSESCTFTWVKPRILDNVRLKLLQSRIDTWHIQANSILLQLEEMTPELLVA